MSQTEKIVNLPLNETEANAIIQLFDAALKATGLQYAGNAMQLLTKIQQAFNAPTPAPREYTAPTPLLVPSTIP